ncbi:MULTISPECIES: cation diffusion facilitator family transporter [unclassified Halanaerobium]|uniref:cation diffusion facilitator family transporter n=1 Tax=unclassified Halanaerobium TaxID=2641197 RepID=UPI000DF391F6|nr:MULTISPECIES: cation diffusion facilitator family transporter [unclassified Halanaerobium]RCW50747.1 cation diffusion facilitator family transporter [Halanaerobium sp. MA284_MarDTE_T2]RCW80187.1 cation diffusion facilitator family transporter [Halanaerobium sp. DL-01]
MKNEELRYQEGKRISIISLITNLLLAALKIIVGYTANSKALIADGFHSFSDMASTIIVMFSIKFSKAPADSNHPYGHEKAEALGTNILSVILLLTGFLLARDAVYSLMEREIIIPGTIALIIAFISIISKEILYRYTIKIGKKINSRGLIADAHHHRSDALSSVAALIGIGGAKLGFWYLDPLAGFVVAVLILKVGYEIMRDSSNELMDGLPEEGKIEQIKKLSQNVSGVIEVEEIKIRSYGPKFIADIIIVVDDNLTVGEGHDIAAKVKRNIMDVEKDFKDVLVHVDPESVHQ